MRRLTANRIHSPSPLYVHCWNRAPLGIQKSNPFFLKITFSSLFAIEGGMAWKRQKLRMVPEAEAQGDVLEIYSEIKQALGLPYINPMFQALGSYPKYFRIFWDALRADLETREFFSLAQRIAAEAYTRVHNYLNVPDLSQRVNELGFSTGAQEELRDVIDLYLYNNSVLLLIVAAEMQGFE